MKLLVKEKTVIGSSRLQGVEISHQLVAVSV